jgi:dihydrolipoamide dehydrogenase
MERDLIIIGGGPGGYAAAIRAAQLGAAVTLVEKERPGGTCLNRGCIPTKALYKNAQLLDSMKHADNFGIKLEGYTCDFLKVQERKQNVVDRFVNGMNQLLKAYGIETVNGSASLLNGRTVVVKKASGEKEIFEGKNILIAAGSSPAVPPVPGIDLPGVVTSDGILELAEITESMVIIGGGVIGIEFAGIYNAFGTKVTVIEFLPRILPAIDEDIVKRLTPSLKKRGIRIETGTKVKHITKGSSGLTVFAEGKAGELEIEAGSVLVSTGRKPNTNGLNLDAVGVEYDRRGIKVDEKYMTSIEGIYAIGDITGGQMLAHVASEEGKAAAENMLGLCGHVNYDCVPACVFAFPEIASVGLMEEEAKTRGIEYNTGKFMFGANGKAMTMGEEEGFVKVLAEVESKRIIGVQIMGPHASDLIHEAALAVENKLTVSDIEKTIHAHPTLPEAFQEAVAGIEGRALYLAPLKRKL